MKRGLIAWDKTEILPGVFDDRLRKVRKVLAAKGVPALAVYSELWRSNPARFFSNYMPYFNRALLILSLEHPPTLLCGLSPRVYTWIRSVTTLEDIRPAGNFSGPLVQLAAERGWNRIGFLDLRQLPCDMVQTIGAAGAIEMVDIESASVYAPGEDATELAMRRKAAVMARAILGEELADGIGKVDHELVGRLEGKFRRAGAEDLIILLTNGAGPPAPPNGSEVEENYSVSLALEYRGHWVRMARPHASHEVLAACRRRIETMSPPYSSIHLENLAGSYPYEWLNGADLKPGSIFAAHVEAQVAMKTGSKRLFYGETCCYGESGIQTL